mmetsp:Transcript_13548/g.32779  ORF Transcript_13548/g.32779 Transcript_13548/m.32779 type:complete len:209 (-) Transcript_13548:2405-3031(-)
MSTDDHAGRTLGAGTERETETLFGSRLSQLQLRSQTPASCQGPPPTEARHPLPSANPWSSSPTRNSCRSPAVRSGTRRAACVAGGHPHSSSTTCSGTAAAFGGRSCSAAPSWASPASPQPSHLWTRDGGPARRGFPRLVPAAGSMSAPAPGRGIHRGRSLRPRRSARRRHECGDGTSSCWAYHGNATTPAQASPPRCQPPAPTRARVA